MKNFFKILLSYLPHVLTSSLAALVLFSYSTAYLDSAIMQDLPVSAPQSADVSAPVSTSAQSAVLLDAKSGEILYSHNKDACLPMASTTKIMTALVVIENSSPDDIVTISREASLVEGSSCYLMEGEKISVKDLLYGLMLESGNDAAHALAESVGGDIEGFVLMMNEKAQSMGLTHTHFDNPHGLTSDNHYTTAHELSLITSQAMENELFRTLVGTNVYKTEETDKSAGRYFSNHNRLLRQYKYCVGVKTGYTQAAGRCLVTCAEKNGSRVVAVTLNDRADWKDHTALLDYALSGFKTVRVADKGEIFFYTDTGEKYTNPQSIYLTLPSDFDGKLGIVCSTDKNTLTVSAESEGYKKERVFPLDTIIVPHFSE